MKRGQHTIRTGFTLVELLTIVAIIAILLAFLVPAFNKVQKVAYTAKQQAQFHGLGIALEAVYTDTGDYPPSAWNVPTYGNYSASQRLAEAVIGRDGLGLHPDTTWYETGVDSSGTALYSPDVDVSTDTGNLAARKGPYLELENANAVKLSTLYGATNLGSFVDSFVLVDMYKIAKNPLTNKLTGSPILYYRANRNQVDHRVSSTSNTYNVSDSAGSLGVGFVPQFTPRVTGYSVHPLAGGSGKSLFYEQTANPNFTSPPRPYRADSFILQSAGPDGLYGTADDVFNFDQDN